MRKYLQISVVLVIFFLLVIFKNIKGDENKNLVGIRNVEGQVISPTKTPTSIPTPTSTSSNNSISPTSIPTATPMPAGLYKDGSYTGGAADAFYGLIQVRAVIVGGRLSDVVFLQFPNDNSTSQYINNQAMQYLKDEAIQAQSANVNIVSGASDSSIAFRQSLTQALSQAR